jgi:hypothetical protein
VLTHDMYRSRFCYRLLGNRCSEWKSAFARRQSLILVDTTFPLPEGSTAERHERGRSHALAASRTIIPASDIDVRLGRNERERGFAGERARFVGDRFSGSRSRASNHSRAILAALPWTLFQRWNFGDGVGGSDMSAKTFSGNSSTKTVPTRQV